MSAPASKNLQSSVSFTLPLSCQICLGKVKEPVTCCNQHVFCSGCINVWLDRNSCCPTCRVEITPQSPVKPIIGGSLHGSDTPGSSQETSRELRRARYELIIKEFEDEIFQLENTVAKLRKENAELKRRAEVDDRSDSAASLPRHRDTSASHGLDDMLEMAEKLQNATKTYKKTKGELNALKQEKNLLVKKVDDLERQNQRIREEFHIRSPAKFGRLTVATLESRLEASQKQVAQLQKALQRNDTYTEQLEAEIAKLKAAEQSVADDDDGMMGGAFEPVTASGKMQQLQISEVVVGCDESANSCRLSAGGGSIAAGGFTDDDAGGACDNSQPNSIEGEYLACDDSSYEPPLSCGSVKYGNELSPFSRRLMFDQHHHHHHDDDDVSTQHELLYDGLIDYTCDASMPAFPTSYEENLLDFAHHHPKRNSAGAKTTCKCESTRTTTISAGSSRITMSQLSAEQQNEFSHRPNSAPSRTFLLSSRRFSALQPVASPAAASSSDRPTAAAADAHPDSSFKPVGLSPMKTCAQDIHMDTRASSPLRLVSPNEVMLCTRWKSSTQQLGTTSLPTPVESSGSSDHKTTNKCTLARVNILKRTVPNSKRSRLVVTPPPALGSDGRRKQKLTNKRNIGEVLFQSPTKSPKKSL